MITLAHWLLTSTTYGTWLPGDPRGFVGRVFDYRIEDEQTDQLASRVEHDQVGTEYDRDIPGLRRAALATMKGVPVYLSAEQCSVVRNQFLQTAKFWNWEVDAIALMANHFHIVISADESLPTDDLFRRFKSYASRELNKRWPRPKSGTWWTASGSRRRLPDERSRDDAIRYVLNQHQPLAIYPESI